MQKDSTTTRLSGTIYGIEVCLQKLDGGPRVAGRTVAVQIKVFKGVGSNRDREYRDVESFLPADAVTGEEKLTV